MQRNIQAVSDMFKRILLLVVFVLSMIIVEAQIVAKRGEAFNTDSLRAEYDSRPWFSLYKDNYFVFGAPVSREPTVKNTNVKFQISISQRVTKSTLPWNTYLYLFYSQKCFWNILERSMPMVDLNFNPGIGIAKPLFVKNRYIGKLMMLIEHESNGKDSIWSRSWNKVSLGANIVIDPTFSIHGKAWIPIIDSQNNKDILDYCGYYQMGMSFLSRNHRYRASIMLTKRASGFFNYNTSIEFGFRPSADFTPYLFLQFYNGYGEGLLDYNVHHSYLRAGIVLKPEFFSDY